jgi:hypothetical protein
MRRFSDDMIDITPGIPDTGPSPSALQPFSPSALQPFSLSDWAGCAAWI